jgi:death-on-curing protein
VAQPEASFGGEELYPDLASKAAALGHSLIQNHPFVDGNKRVGHAAVEVFSYLTAMKLMRQLMSRSGS